MEEQGNHPGGSYHFNWKHVPTLDIDTRTLRTGAIMTQEKTGPDATPRIGLDLGRQIFDDTGPGSQPEGQSDTNEGRIRQRAYEIWESEGRSGDPHDHWHRAERELKGRMPEQSDATVEDVSPAAAVEAMGAVTDQAVDENPPQKKTRRKRTT